jgi:hypothetical protein
MLHKPCLPALLRLASEGRSRIEAERRALLMALAVFILWALMGIGAPAARAAILPAQPLRAPVRGHRCNGPADCLISPAPAGTAERFRPALHH